MSNTGETPSRTTLEDQILTLIKETPMKPGGIAQALHLSVEDLWPTISSLQARGLVAPDIDWRLTAGKFTVAEP